MPFSWCQSTSLLGGKPKQGLHQYRIPGTDTAAIDFVATLLGAWLVSFLTHTSLVITTITVLVLGMIFHRLLCVKTATLQSSSVSFHVMFVTWIIFFILYVIT